MLRSPKCFFLSDFSTKILYAFIIPAFLHGCENWSVTLREEHRWYSIWKQGRRLFGYTKDEVPGRWRKLYNE
jgi:hypothetical protein